MRHDNLSQGIALGANTISASGSLADQSLALRAKGTGTITLLSPVAFGAARTVTLTGTNGGGPWGDWAGATMCPSRQYVCGVRLKTEASQGDGDDSALNDVDIYCCTLGN